MTDERSDASEALEERRRNLLRGLDGLRESKSTPAAALDWELQLLDELIWCEEARNETNSVELKLHGDLVRYIGDGLVWFTLGHTVFRVLSRTYHKPPGLASQRESIAHVVNVAKALCDDGFVPLITDVSHAGQAGDILASARDAVFIIECKNRDAPKDGRIGGRLSKQIDAMLAAASYLSGDLGAYTEPDGRAWLTFAPSAHPTYSFDTLARSLEEARATGESLQVVEPGDLFMTSCSGTPSAEILRNAMQHLPARAVPVIGGPHRLATEPPHHQAPLSTWPLSVEDRADLMSQQIVSVHVVDILPYQAIDDNGLNIEYLPGIQAFSCRLGDQSIQASGRFLDDVVIGCELRSGAIQTFHNRIREILTLGRLGSGQPVPVLVAVAYRDCMIVPVLLESST